MTTPGAYFTSVLSSTSLDQQYVPSSSRGRPRGSLKRGRKPRGTGTPNSPSPRPLVADGTSPTIASGPSNTNISSAQYPRVHWALPSATGVGIDETGGASSSTGVSGTGLATSSALPIPASSINLPSIPTSGSQQAVSTLDLAGLLSLNPTSVYRPAILPTNRPGHAPDEDGEGEDELLPAMADDDYSAQLSWQSQSKDNLKCVISLSISHN